MKPLAYRKLLALCLLLAAGIDPAAASPQLEPGLSRVECWFETDGERPALECFRMVVPENHDRPNGRLIWFPVLRLAARPGPRPRAPVLHLGAGGPGAAMYLDSAETVDFLRDYHDELSLEQQRDLIIIDPRGAGLAQPALVCHEFLRNLARRLTQNLSMREEWQAVDRDYRTCIDDYQRQGVELGTYNSRSVALDIERLRTALDVERWVLIGVSYASIYAQMIAREFPQTVESMVLDSATFPNLAGETDRLQRELAPYRALFDPCRADDDCRERLPGLERRFWALYHELDREPLEIDVTHPYDGSRIDLVLNGERFLGALLQGVYDVEVYRDLPAIVTELERRRYRRLMPYIDAALQFMFDSSYGDVSMETHYCYDTHPYTDFDDLERQIAALPDGYYKTMLSLSLEFDDYCEIMGIHEGYPPMAEARQIEVPTLFLHGRLDSVTLLDDVVAQRRYFDHSRLVTFDEAHSMLSTDECAEAAAARFVDDPDTPQAGLRCD